MKVCYYQTLGIAKDVDTAEIKKAYRKLAMQFHPDKNPGDKAAESKFKEINEAYAVLQDGEKRAAYDRFGHAAFEQGGPGGFGGAGFGGFDFATGFADIFDEMFGDIMGGARGRAGQGRGADLRHDLPLTLEEAFAGVEKVINVVSSISCESCAGTGAKPGSGASDCTTCNGRGRVRAQQGFFTIERACASCAGQGQVIKDPCRNCAGQGRVRNERKLSVNVPAGVEDGTRIRLSGEGEAGMRGNQPGDLYVILTIDPHKSYQREGANLFCRVPVAMTSAALGGAVNVPLIEGGEMEIKIEPGTQPGQQMRLRQKGMSVLRTATRGDLYVELAVETPVKLSKRQKELLEEFAREGEKGGGGIVGKIKETLRK
ncbi:MAG: molecular chaperone DnaJ [Alphaproteobacteria bacterium]|nr:molecular chaperone DnaJ [Alphaproteobacteria bacterium]